MARLILHIGAHKTGTTSVQKFFKMNEGALAAHGVAYPLTGRKNAHYILAAPWISGMEHRHGFTPADGLKTWDHLDREWADHDGVVFISSEAFCRQWPDRVDFREVAALTQGFEKVEIVYVVRDQLSAIQSVFMQRSRNQRNAPSFQDVLRSAFEGGGALPITFRHADVLTQTESGFAPDAIRLVNYDTATKSPGGVIGYFLRLCGVPAKAFSETKFVRENISADPLSHLLAAERCAPESVQQSIVDQCRAKIEQRFGEDARTTMFTRDEIQTLRAHFEPMNEDFATRITAEDECAGPIVLPDFEGFVTRDLLDEAFLSGLPGQNSASDQAL